MRKALEQRTKELNKVQEELRATREQQEDRREVAQLRSQLLLLQRSMAQARDTTTHHHRPDASHLPGRDTPAYGVTGQFDRSSLTGPVAGPTYASGVSGIDDSMASRRRGIEVGGGEISVPEGMSGKKL